MLAPSTPEPGFRRAKAALALGFSLCAGAPALADVTLINVFEVPEGRLSETISAWEAARDYLEEQPGYVSTELHRALAEDARFALVNVAIWRSVDDFMAASRAMAENDLFPEVEGLGVNPALYRVIEGAE
ncbi:antibiotic biosynthesis monooxygenase [Roseibacterium beibuensis]|nr:antibiotic biosynthesis monooxygenase family protein [Roseibacterium beibuensis]MCS6622337.1 antibiotic biosynthesis monooxygenase [Roseibacterium beibuensis]